MVDSLLCRQSDGKGFYSKRTYVYQIYFVWKNKTLTRPPPHASMEIGYKFVVGKKKVIDMIYLLAFWLIWKGGNKRAIQGIIRIFLTLIGYTLFTFLTVGQFNFILPVIWKCWKQSFMHNFFYLGGFPSGANMYGDCVSP